MLFRVTKASDIISTSTKAREIATRLGGSNWKDLFQEAWLRVREQELKGKTINNPIAYFYLVALNLSKYKKTRQRRNDLVKFVQLSQDIEHPAQDTEPSKLDDYDQIASAYIVSTSDNEVDQFYREFCELYLLCGSKKEVINILGIKYNTFYRVMNSLTKKLNDELNKV